LTTILMRMIDFSEKGADQTEYTHLQAPVEVGLCTILETTELQESFHAAKSRNATCLVEDESTSGELSNIRETDMNINCEEDESEADTSASNNTARRASLATDAARRKSVTFSERLTQAKIIEESTRSNSKSSIKITHTSAAVVTTTALSEVSNNIEAGIPRPILKVKEKQANEETIAPVIQRKSVIRSSRKSSQGGEMNNSGGDRRRSRIYSIGGGGCGGGMNAPLISEEALREAQAELLREGDASEDTPEVIERTLLDDMVAESAVETEEESGEEEPREVAKEPAVAITRPPPAPGKPRNSIFKAKQKKADENSIETAVNEPGPTGNKDKNIQGRLFENILFFFMKQKSIGIILIFYSTTI
jgi:hypothetical protein